MSRKFGIDLATLYEVETRVFNQAVKSNIESFPDDFMFRLSRKEWRDLTSQFVMSYGQEAEIQSNPSSQFVMMKDLPKTELENICLMLLPNMVLRCSQVF